MTPLLQTNADVIAWVEAGFIGAWGEWHTSTNGLDNLTDKRDILNALIAAIPDRYVQVRYPANIIEMYPNPADAVKARVAHHNDCFLSSNTDVGTYERDGTITIERDQKYLAELTRFTPMSGETCAPNPPRSECASAIREMELLHFSAINEAYHKGILRSWEEGGCYEEIVVRSGVPGQKVRNVPVGYATMIGVKLAHAFVFIALPIWVTPFAWWQVALGFLLMHFTAGVILGSVFQLAPVVEGAQQPLPNEVGVIASDWTVHELLTTADFAPRNKVVTWFTGGLNYQIEHHLFPYISHLHYPRIAPIVQRTAAEFGLPYNVKPTLWQALRSHVRRLRQLGRAVPAAVAA